MGDKWPFIIIVFGLLFALGFTIVNLEKSVILKNWTSRRCELPIVAAAMLLKPDSDPRTSTAFAIDNFEFCMKSYIDSFMNLFITPINAIFGQHINVAAIAMDAINSIRKIAQELYNAFLTYLSQYFKRFNTSIFEISRIIQYVRMAVNRGVAMGVSMIYTGITAFRGMINAIQFIIKIILIICTIIIILLIILFLILFPIIPFIITTLVEVIKSVLRLSTMMSSTIANDANDKKKGFCFSEDTFIRVKSTTGIVLKKSVKDIVIGDELADNCGKVTAVIKMDGSGISLYNLNGVYLSGTHLVKGLDGIWKAVADDIRAIKTEKESSVLYCFNTTSNNIPVNTCTDTVLLCRDWEEIGNDDEKGQYIWNYVVSQLLNKDSLYTYWKDNIKMYVNVAVIGKDTLVKTDKGFIRITDIGLNTIVLDKNGNKQVVKGVVSAEIEDGITTDNDWRTEMYELHGDVWLKGKSTMRKGNNAVYGLTLITESGEFTIWDKEMNKEIVVRDFTEVGYKSIHQTYSFVEARLRITEPSH